MRLAKVALGRGEVVVVPTDTVYGIAGDAFNPKAVEKLLATMQRDKKSRAGSLRFVVLEEVGKPVILTAPSVELLHAAYQEICA